MGFRRFSHAFTEVRDALKAGDLGAARRALAAWRGRRHRRALERRHREARDRARPDRFVPAGVRDAVLVHGAAGARGRRALSRGGAPRRRMARQRSRGAETTPIATARAVFGGPARGLLWLLDWIPVRLTALSFAIVGDFEDAALLLAHAGGGVGDAGGRRARGHRARERRRRARREARRRAAGGRRTSPSCAPSSASATSPTPICCRARSASSGARWCSGCC